MAANHNKLRQAVLLQGICKQNGDLDANNCSFRGRVWQVSLQSRVCPVIPLYTALVAKRFHDKFGNAIANDTFRTFRTDPSFHEHVSQEALTRVLHAFAHFRDSRGETGYLQGMNVLAGMFLFVMPEPDAFTTLVVLVSSHCPTYFTPDLAGARAGAVLVDYVLEIFDPQLHQHLNSKNLTATIYAFASVLTLCASTPPLSEALVMWDFLMCHGVHWNVLLCASQCINNRTQLLQSSQPLKELRAASTSDAKVLIATAVVLIDQIPSDLYQRIVAHTTDESVVKQILGASLRKK
eukprot:c8109_g1_i1.p1 GENE.c8109_g1_i1~~c8109_g1_i1.p1  ORF type:complete len:294 (+),score=56.43 c8109_g1_i1:56-937(+)